MTFLSITRFYATLYRLFKIVCKFCLIKMAVQSKDSVRYRMAYSIIIHLENTAILYRHQTGS